MDNNLITNNPLTPYLQPNNDGVMCIVADFDEARKKQTPKDSKRVYFSEDLKHVFAKLTDKDGKVTMATFELKQVPNPVPVTDIELSGKIGELAKSFDSRFQSLETSVNKIMEYIAKGQNNVPIGVLQQQSTATTSSAE